MTLRLGVALVLMAAGVTAVVAQQGQEPPQTPAVTFRSAIEAVEIDVYVADADGNAVAGLTADDFELIEDGAPQPITTFAAIDIPIERADVTTHVSAESDVVSNNGPQGRIYLFALDEVGDEKVLQTRRIAREFIENHFGPSDIGAVAVVGRGLATDGQDFTGNRQLLLEAVDRFTGGFPRESGGGGGGAPNPVPPEPCTAGRLPGDVRTSGRSQQLASLRSLTELMARMPGRHKAMLFFTECIGVDMRDLVDYNGGTLGLAGDDAHAAMAAATRSNLAIYPIDPGGLSPAAVPLETIGAFRAMADATGGVALINSNGFARTFERIVGDNSTYYMLGFNSGYHKDDGRYVRLEVTVKRPGLTVRTRDGYVAPTRAERRATEQARKRDTVPQSAASAAVASPLPTGGIPMRVTAAAFRASEDDARVALAVELDAAALGLAVRDGAFAGDVDVSFLATDATRRIYPEVRYTASIRAEPRPGGQQRSLDGVRVRIVSAIQLPQGRRYQLRVGTSTRSQAGGVVYDLEVPDFSEGDLAMSGLALLSPAESNVLTLQSTRSSGKARAVKCYSARCEPAAAAASLRRVEGVPAEEFMHGALPGPPTTAREFARGERVVVAAQVYDNRRLRKNEPPHRVALTASLRNQSGEVIPLIAEERSSTSPSGPSGEHTFALRLPLAGVAPGAYVLQVEARSSAGEGRVASREIPFGVK